MQSQKQTISKVFIAILAFFWLLAKLMSYKVWVANRMFVLVPVTKVFHNLPNEIHLALYGISLVLLFLLLFNPKRIYFLFLIISEVLSCLLDQNRWQPWEYQFILMSLVCYCYYYQKQAAYFWCTVIIATIYFYSGLHKVHYTFVHFFWKQTILLKFFKLSNTSTYFPYWVKIGYIAAALEALAGLAILLRFYKKQAAWFLIVMHVFILLVIGPLGINYNKIVWGWNIAMIFFLYWLCIKEPTVRLSYLKPIFPNALIILLMGLLPILSFFNKWDYYLSSCLYSAKPPAITIKTNKPPKYFLTNKISFVKNTDSLCTIHVQTWAMKEMGVPPYPEKRVLQEVVTYAIKEFNFKPNEFVWRELDK